MFLFLLLLLSFVCFVTTHFVDNFNIKVMFYNVKGFVWEFSTGLLFPVALPFDTKVNIGWH